MISSIRFIPQYRLTTMNTVASFKILSTPTHNKTKTKFG